jgi:hypothetical protein
VIVEALSSTIKTQPISLRGSFSLSLDGCRIGISRGYLSWCGGIRHGYKHSTAEKARTAPIEIGRS